METTTASTRWVAANRRNASACPMPSPSVSCAKSIPGLKRTPLLSERVVAPEQARFSPRSPASRGITIVRDARWQPGSLSCPALSK
jgi:hypothetical protein